MLNNQLKFGLSTKTANTFFWMVRLTETNYFIFILSVIRSVLIEDTELDRISSELITWNK